ncbi:hypothetical protein LZ31DRAFT_159588 [Colletotrichum somersetense]|nr:hypothetical protein LZ31DRAFT_159588 [Colletotrichum somersetense]
MLVDMPMQTATRLILLCMAYLGSSFDVCSWLLCISSLTRVQYSTSSIEGTETG